MFQEANLEQKEKSLEGFPTLNKSDINKFIGVLRKAGDWDLIRINPYRFASTSDFKPEVALDLFLHGAKIGLFDIAYNMICPACGGVAASHKSLDQIDEDYFHCYICNMDVPTTLDDQVEVTFTIHPSVKRIDVVSLSLQDVESYYRYHFSANYQKSPQLLRFIRSNLHGLLRLDPDESTVVNVDAEKLKAYQFTSVENNSAVFLYFDKEGSQKSNSIELNLLPSGFTPAELHLPKGKYDIKVTNNTIGKAGGLHLTPSMNRIAAIVKDHPTKIEKFLTAKNLLNNQTFRDLFRVQQLRQNLNLNVKSLTIMFTDLRGSTEMYDKAGDMVAYRLVKEHFRLLMDVVKKHNGAIVKTMGDAIMAAFSSPLEGLLASLDMMTKIDQMNRGSHAHDFEIGLKVGLNEGPSLAVINDERLDYFGHSVNIAARVQGLAKAGEIWVTNSVLNTPGVDELLLEKGYNWETSEASLKGVGQKAVVHKLSPAVA
ncbi:adenylate/guanylate cyclase catalytic domain protein [Leptospira broomii serovar Hurstbridge str. 5399]|uniref:Adenylate/guanylate cyclase catalytic domain protein n=1 Tax=Leptospira broomii serovar Hurstbridge str. 5399 TaxID=1049789 RepID=T0GD96_9LEPT|nr:adenylate/guanylate cyclase domain-containing protein [Leptospira broomii]EQA44774.1 adenylate/guanylate cyclase catalytic domain protein [Leptospira broomii serovar Hurstbridge str. 5399]